MPRIGKQSVSLHYAVMRDLTVEQYHMVQPNWNGSALTQLRRNLPRKVSGNLMEETQEESQNTTPPLLP